jgi:hypothetical protein
VWLRHFTPKLHYTKNAHYSGVREYMRTVIIIFFGLFCGCTYITNDVHMKKVVAPGWQEGENVYSYSCKNSMKISVLLNKTLATEGSAYLLFGVAPIGKASFSDQDLNLSVVYNAKEKACKTDDVYLSINNEKVSASKVWQSEERQACVYLWPNKLSKSGSLGVNFKNIPGCNIPPIEIQYEKKTKYNYDSLAG